MDNNLRGAQVCEKIRRNAITIKAVGYEIIKFVGNVPIQVVSIFVLLLHIVTSTHCINKEIKLQENVSNREEGRILRAKRANKLTAEFLLVYILPMIAFDFGSLDSIILFLIYFVVLSFLCVRNSNVYTNIFLEFKGYKMYECDIECGIMDKKYVYTDCLVISKSNLTQPLPRKIQYFDFENYIYIDIRGTNGKADLLKAMRHTDTGCMSVPLRTAIPG